MSKGLKAPCDSFGELFRRTSKFVQFDQKNTILQLSSGHTASSPRRLDTSLGLKRVIPGLEKTYLASFSEVNGREKAPTSCLKEGGNEEEKTPLGRYYRVESLEGPFGMLPIQDASERVASYDFLRLLAKTIGVTLLNEENTASSNEHQSVDRLLQDHKVLKNWKSLSAKEMIQEFESIKVDNTASLASKNESVRVGNVEELEKIFREKLPIFSFTGERRESQEKRIFAQLCPLSSAHVRQVEGRLIGRLDAAPIAMEKGSTLTDDDKRTKSLANASLAILLTKGWVCKLSVTDFTKHYFERSDEQAVASQILAYYVHHGRFPSQPRSIMSSLGASLTHISMDLFRHISNRLQDNLKARQESNMKYRVEEFAFDRSSMTPIISLRII